MGIRSCLSRGSRLKFLFIGWVRICPQGSAFLTAKYAKYAKVGFHGNSFVSFVWFTVENPLHPLGSNLPARISILNRQIRLIRESGIPWEFVRVFRHHHKIVAEGKRVDGQIRCAIAGRQSTGVDSLMPRRPKEDAESWWQMSIHEKFHASIRCWLRALREQAANSRQARRSSRSRSGNSARTSSNESPPARYSMIDSTGYRRPRMTGFP